MSKIIKIINNETIEIRDCRCSAVLYPEKPPTLQNIKDQIEHYEDWCVFKAVINPFQMYAENQEKDKEIDRLNNIIKAIEENLYLIKDEYTQHLFKIIIERLKENNK